MHRAVTLGYYLKDCAGCENLCREYEHAVVMYFTLEREFLSALHRRDHASIRSLKPKVDEAWRIRAWLRAAIRQRGIVTGRFSAHDLANSGSLLNSEVDDEGPGPCSGHKS